MRSNLVSRLLLIVAVLVVAIPAVAGPIATFLGGSISTAEVHWLKQSIPGNGDAIDDIVDGVEYYTATLTTAFNGVAANDCKDSAAVTVTGAATGDACSVTPNATSGALDLTFGCYVSAANAAKVHVCNVTGSTIGSISSGAYYIKVENM